MRCRPFFCLFLPPSAAGRDIAGDTPASTEPRTRRERPRMLQRLPCRARKRVPRIEWCRERLVRRPRSARRRTVRARAPALPNRPLVPWESQLFLLAPSNGAWQGSSSLKIEGSFIFNSRGRRKILARQRNSGCQFDRPLIRCHFCRLRTRRMP